MPRGSLRPSLVIVAALAAAGALRAQNPTGQRPTFRSTTDLVEVDVVAVDEHGEPVRGLTAADFTLLDRKKPQAIATFQEIAHEHDEVSDLATTSDNPPPPKRDVASNTSAQSDRLVVVVIDDLHIFKGRTDRARDIARTVVRELGAQASMAILFTSGNHNVEITEDRAELLVAADIFTGRRPYPRPILGVDDMHGHNPEPTQDIKEFYDDRNAYKTLQDAAHMLGADDGRRKAFVLITEGIAKDLSGVFGAMAVPGQVVGGEAYVAGDLETSIKPAPIEYHLWAVIDMMDAMRRSNVATYIIDPRGAVSPQQLARECHPSLEKLDDPCLGGSLPDWNSYVRQAQHGLEMIAAASGGTAVTNSDDFTGGLNRILDDLDHYYLLGFYPADPNGGGYRRLDVRVNRPDVTLRFRHGYVAGGPPAPPKNSDPLVALSAGVMPRTDLALRLTAIPGVGARAIDAAGKPTGRVLTPVNIAMEVAVPRRGITGAAGTVGDTLRYTVLAADLKSGKIVKQFSNTAVLTSQGTSHAPAVEGIELAADTIAFQFPVQLTLPPGRYQLRASAVSDRLARGGSVYLALDVPNEATAPIAMSGLLVAYSEGPRVLVAAPASGAGLPFPPALDREFSEFDTLRVAFDAITRTPADPLHAVVEIADGTGRVLKSYPPPADGGHVDVRVPLANLPPGAYVLRATVSDRTHSTARDVGFGIR